MNWNYLRASGLALAWPVISAAAAGTVPPTELQWDAHLKTYQAERGETNAAFIFQFANPGPEAIVIRALRPTCRCTVASVPAALPWTIAAGTAGEVYVNVDLRDRWVPFRQTVTIDTSAGTNEIRVMIQTPELTPREKNQRSAFADRQAIFKGECVQCHLAPAIGKAPSDQWAVLCGTCHEAKERAPFVPELSVVAADRDRAYWEEWIRLGKPGTFMPAFAKRYGGPLSDQEIQRLIEYATERSRVQPLPPIKR